MVMIHTMHMHISNIAIHLVNSIHNTAMVASLQACLEVSMIVLHFISMQYLIISYLGPSLQLLKRH